MSYFQICLLFVAPLLSSLEYTFDGVLETVGITNAIIFIFETFHVLWNERKSIGMCLLVVCAIDINTNRNQAMPSVMAGAKAIKLFQNVRKFYRTLGIYPPSPTSNQTISLNRKNLFILSGSLITFTLPSAYLLFEAKSISEFGIPFCVSVIILSTIAINLIQIWRGGRIYQFIENCDGFIEQRK